jgi:predicted DNA-binding transcriptional regulator AlpA
MSDRYRLKPDPTPCDPMRMLRVSRVAELLGVHPMSVWRWVRRGEFPRPIKLAPHVTAWRASDVAAWLDEKRGEQEADRLEQEWLEVDD